MTLRTRILLGYGYLIGLLLLSVSVAAINSQRVAGNAKQILERNIRSLTQAITMLEQLERQDSETLYALLHPTTGTGLDEAENGFEAALQAAEEVSKAGGDETDGPTLAAVRENFDIYRKARAELLSRVYEDSLAAAEDYRGPTQKTLLVLKLELGQYVKRKTEALKQANDEASRSAVEGAVLLGVMVTVALLSLGFLSRSLQRDVLGRLTEVGHVTEAIAAGDRRRRVRDFYQDELGLVARQLNAALDRQHELESQMQGRLLEQRRILVGLMNQWPTPAGMIGIDGELVATTLTPEDEAELHRLTPRVRIAAKVLMTRRFVKAEELAVDIKASDGRRVVQIRALASGDNQIAGWLASFVDPRQIHEPSGVQAIARDMSGVYPIAPELSGAHPVPREPSGVFPIGPDLSSAEQLNAAQSGAHEDSGPLGSAESGAGRPVARGVSSSLAPTSGPLRAAVRETSGARPQAPVFVAPGLAGPPVLAGPPLLAAPVLAPVVAAPVTAPVVAAPVTAPVTAPAVAVPVVAPPPVVAAAPVVGAARVSASAASPVAPSQPSPEPSPVPSPPGGADESS